MLQSSKPLTVGGRTPRLVVPGISPRPGHPVAGCPRPHVAVRTVKNPGVTDYADVQPGRKTKPMERAEKEFDLELMLTKSKTWQQVKQLVTESPHKFVRDHELTCSTLSRFSELTGRLAAVKKGAERAEARAFVDSLADILLPNMHTMRAQGVCSVMLSLSHLGYAQPKLIQAVFYFLAEKERLTYPDPVKAQEKADQEGGYVNLKPKTIFSVGERFALLSLFARLGVRPPPAALSSVLANSLPFMKFCSPEDTANLVQALHAWRGKLHPKFADALVLESRSQLPSLSGTALVCLMSLASSAGQVPSSYSTREVLKALQPHLEGASGLPSPSLYPAVMATLLRMKVKVPPELFDAMASALLEAPSADKKATKASRKAPAAAEGAVASCRLDALSPREVVVVLAALGVQSKYTPEDGLVEKLLGLLQIRCSELTASEAAAAVTLLPAVLQDADSRDDAAEALDELLAVVEGGLGAVPSALLQALAAALAGLGHNPDTIWSAAFEAEVTGRVRLAGACVEATRGAEALRSRKKDAVAPPLSPELLGRPSLVALASALASLPGRVVSKPQQSQSSSLSVTDLASFSSSLVTTGAFLGGYNDEQLLSVHRSLTSLGVKMASVKLPIAAEADDALDHELGQRPAASTMTAGTAAVAAEVDGEPDYFLGYSELEHDLPELLQAVSAFHDFAEDAAQGREQAEGAPGMRRPGSAQEGRYGRDAAGMDGGEKALWFEEEWEGGGQQRRPVRRQTPSRDSPAGWERR